MKRSIVIMLTITLFTCNLQEFEKRWKIGFHFLFREHHSFSSGLFLYHTFYAILECKMRSEDYGVCKQKLVAIFSCDWQLYLEKCFNVDWDWVFTGY